MKTIDQLPEAEIVRMVKNEPLKRMQIAREIGSSPTEKAIYLAKENLKQNIIEKYPDAVDLRFTIFESYRSVTVPAHVEQEVITGLFLRVERPVYIPEHKENKVIVFCGLFFSTRQTAEQEGGDHETH